MLNQLREWAWFLSKPLVEWGPGSKFPEFQAKFVDHATEGLISLGLIVGGFILALALEKKIGWILLLVGLGLLVHLFGFV